MRRADQRGHLSPAGKETFTAEFHSKENKKKQGQKSWKQMGCLIEPDAIILY